MMTFYDRGTLSNPRDVEYFKFLYDNAPYRKSLYYWTSEGENAVLVYGPLGFVLLSVLAVKLNLINEGWAFAIGLTAFVLCRVIFSIISLIRWRIAYRNFDALQKAEYHRLKSLRSREFLKMIMLVLVGTSLFLGLAYILYLTAK